MPKYSENLIHFCNPVLEHYELEDEIPRMFVRSMFMIAVETGGFSSSASTLSNHPKMSLTELASSGLSPGGLGNIGIPQVY